MLHSFDDFINEAKVQRVATIKAETDAEITRKLEKLLREASKLNDEVESERAKFEQAIKIKELELKSKQAALVEAMQQMGTTSIKYKKILATIETSKGRVTHAYAKLWEFALLQANENQKKALLEFQNVNKKINPDKLKLEIRKVAEAENFLGNLLSNIWNFLKEKAKAIKAVFNEYTQSVEALETVVEAGIKAGRVDHGGEEL